MEELGNRLKENYEKRNTYHLIRRMPVIIRVDGRSFHSVTRSYEKPFDSKHIECMRKCAMILCNEIQGCKVAYTQSDEVSFLLIDYNRLETSAWFDYNKSKIETATASLMSVYYNKYISELGYNLKEPCTFDARSFNIPKEEVCNYFLWRGLDCERNSINMYSSFYFSHKQLQDKNSSDRHEMLHGIGKNWATDLKEEEKNGTFVMENKFTTIKPSYINISDNIKLYIDNPEYD